MKLIAFRIRNFRSIVDSGLNQVSNDNITVLIGQNESGKTSVLEALHCFYNGEITDDMLRSDMSVPEVSCLFSLEKGEDYTFLEQDGFPSLVAAVIRAEKQIMLVRSWNRDKTSSFKIEGEKTDEIYANHITRFTKELEEMVPFADQILVQESEMAVRLSSLKKELEKNRKLQDSLTKRITDLQKSVSKSKDNAQKERYNMELDRSAMENSQLLALIAGMEKQINELTPQYKQLTEKSFYARSASDSVKKFDQIKKELEQLLEQEKQIQNQKNLLKAGSKDYNNLGSKEAHIKSKLAECRRNMLTLRQEMVYGIKLLGNIIKGMTPEQARAISAKDTTALMELGTPEEAGQICIRFIPVFEFFEDFSSLLPNRIDLDDLLNENRHAEGYKAVKNLLIIAGIDASFFSQQNNRILKQKIENLNGELTVNFQDYWSQNVGKNNKIKIQFELEHYDLSNAEKKGKPYLEFWIKDERERLYPKQRSRGVRWFLSFYLEVKATARERSGRRILLIDEPGLSLHARAQEDVLKVFEDLKSDLMILYCTHSPHLIDVNKINRILAVQRAVEDDETSETLIIDTKSLARASADTLSPIYALMGTRITDHQYIQKSNNVIVENVAEYYYLNGFLKLLEVAEQISFIPANGPSGVSVLANLLTGWKLDFIVLTNDNDSGNIVRNELKINLFGNNDHLASQKLLSVENNHTVVDLFSTIDFKNHVLQKRIGITETNAEYIQINDLSETLLAMDFYNRVMEQKVSWKDFDDETQGQISDLVKRLVTALKQL